jgi:hypothetical protein
VLHEVVLCVCVCVEGWGSSVGSFRDVYQSVMQALVPAD